ncbi:MAG: sensor histidine kinase [Candidatus Obscuribacterales bacterium]|nr:sensor histidine kinase [Candidatus Obscuribacterales bacterium]
MTAAHQISKEEATAGAGMPGALLDKSLMSIQGALVLILVLCHTLALPLVERVAEPPNPTVAVVLLFCSLVLFFSHRRSYSRRLLLLLALSEAILIAAASVFGLPRLFPIMYLLIVARTGLLLSDRELLYLVAICIMIYLAGKEARYLLTERAFFSLSATQHILHLLVVGRLFNFAIAVSFSALCVSAVKGERKSRLEREKLNSEVEQMSKTLERTRIAREIHDNVGHTLTSLNMQLELAQKLLVKKPEKVADTLRAVKEFAQRARLDLESSLKAPERENTGLKGKLESLISDSNQLNSFNTQLFFNAFDPDERIQHEIYCIVKEALNNVKKYAGAQTATVVVAELDGRLLVDVEDDGTGFDTSIKIANKYGLRGMSERAELIDGSLKIESRIGGGTKVMLSVPFRPAANACARVSKESTFDGRQREDATMISETLEIGGSDER